MFKMNRNTIVATTENEAPISLGATRQVRTQHSPRLNRFGGNRLISTVFALRLPKLVKLRLIPHLTLLFEL